MNESSLASSHHSRLYEEKKTHNAFVTFYLIYIQYLNYGFVVPFVESMFWFYRG